MMPAVSRFWKRFMWYAFRFLESELQSCMKRESMSECGEVLSYVNCFVGVFIYIYFLYLECLLLSSVRDDKTLSGKGFLTLLDFCLINSVPHSKRGYQ